MQFSTAFHRQISAFAQCQMAGHLNGFFVLGKIPLRDYSVCQVIHPRSLVFLPLTLREQDVGRYEQSGRNTEAELKQSLKAMYGTRDTILRCAVGDRFKTALAELHEMGYHVTIARVKDEVEIELRRTKDTE